MFFLSFLFSPFHKKKKEKYLRPHMKANEMGRIKEEKKIIKAGKKLS